MKMIMKLLSFDVNGFSNISEPLSSVISVYHQVSLQALHRSAGEECWEIPRLDLDIRQDLSPLSRHIGSVFTLYML